MRPIPQVAIDFVKQHEACVLRVYDDARPNYVLQPGDECQGTLTAGVGHTGGLSICQVVTQDDADRWIVADLTTASARLGAMVDRSIIDTLTDNQYAALLSFVFNVGADASWTIWKMLNARSFDQVPLQLAKFVNAGGKKLQGLVNRRNAEIALWSLNEPGSVDINPPSSVTRAAITPPTASDPVPAAKSKTMIAGGISALAAIPPAVSQISTAIGPYSDKSDFVAHMLAILAIIGAVAAGLTALWFYLHKQQARN